jgi:peptidoglycan/LPS O-acetylase OafA/YrhL
MVYHPAAQIFMGLGIIFLLGTRFLFIGHTILEAMIFIILILNISTNKSFFLKLENPWYAYLGNISFGIYMYHTLCIAIVMTILQKIGLDKENWIAFNAILYSVSIILTIGLAGLSYKYYESYFLTLKQKFMIVVSSTKKS